MQDKAILTSTTNHITNPTLYVKDADYWNKFLTKVNIAKLIWKLELSYNNPINILLGSYADLKDQLQAMEEAM
jgi:hypothetical protein